MLMRMLCQGGMPLLTDTSRSPDIHNPHGYFEFAPVRRTREDASWVAAARGKAVKVVAPLLHHLPPDHSYAGVFIRRPLHEILLSQQRMLGKPDHGDAAIRDMLAEELNRSLGWLGLQPNWRVLCLEYHALLREPHAAAKQMNDFIGGLDTAAMARAVDPSLHRSRAELARVQYP